MAAPEFRSSPCTAVERKLLQKVDDGKIVDEFHHEHGWVTRDMTEERVAGTGSYGRAIGSDVERLPPGLVYRRTFDDFPENDRTWRLTPFGLIILGTRPVVPNPFIDDETGELPAPGTVSCLQAARFYASLGMPVFPVGANKRPLIRRGLQAATTSDAQIQKWWKRYPRAGVAARTGLVADIVDIDGTEGVETVRARVDDEAWASMPVSRTGREGGGFHYWVEPSGARNKVGMFKTLDNPKTALDYRGQGGYAVMPPSLHHSGQPYRWVRPITGLELALPLVPDGLRPGLVEPPRPKRNRSTELAQLHLGRSTDDLEKYGLTALLGECEKVRHAPAAGANHQLFKSACKLFELVNGGVLDEHVAFDSLMDAALDRGQSESEARSSIGSGMKRVRGKEPRLPQPRRFSVTASRSTTSNRAATASRPASAADGTRGRQLNVQRLSVDKPQ